ncbi:spore coat protein [Amycolatopsis suaedae]|uniref:Spore coat protein n=1 Tax=Amycolatopsis suaedae TaxID=2510978 RepID=A0A4Q7J5P7_9PSEU|nr:spore coat protein [Amycolatopsis suaedae]RZQ62022.1 spore coat protein [Amycolatopsis suaedae]
MRLLLRADSSAEIGAGHIARVVAFAEHAVARGWTVSFAGRTTNAEWLAARFDQLGVPRLPDGPLGELAAGHDAVLVDHYGLGELRDEVNAAGALLVSMEDGTFGRRRADIVVDCGLHRADRPADDSPVLLTGPAYAPLRQVVQAARASRDGEPHDPPRVLVVLGGGGVWSGVVSGILTALRDTSLPFAAEALVRGEPAVPDPLPGQRFLVAPPSTELPRLLAGADLVISAAGVTLLELCCIGVPTALVRLVDNQATGYRAAVDQGLAAGLESGTDLASVTEVLTGLLAEPARREKLAAAAAAAVDGRGADRVLDAIAQRSQRY